MDPEAQAALFDEFAAKRKRTSVGYLLWLVGFHYLYYSRVGLFFAYWLTWGGLGLWALADIFRMHSVARAANEQIARQALQTLGLAAFSAPQLQPPAQLRPTTPAASSPPDPGLTNPVLHAPADAATSPPSPPTDIPSTRAAGGSFPRPVESHWEPTSSPLPTAEAR